MAKKKPAKRRKPKKAKHAKKKAHKRAPKKRKHLKRAPKKKIKKIHAKKKIKKPAVKKPAVKKAPPALAKPPKPAVKPEVEKPKPVKPIAKPRVEKPVPVKPAARPKKAQFYVKVENVVAFVDLGKRIPLNKLVGAMESAEYEPEQFPGLVYRTKEPRAAALIFSSGKIVCTGAKNIEKAKQAIAKVVDKIRKTGVRLPRKYRVQVENIVASSKIKAALNLEEITFSLENAEYEPEQFPGLVYRIPEPRVAFLLFSSGKIICTGAHKIEDIHAALNKLKSKLESIGIKVKPVKD